MFTPDFCCLVSSDFSSCFHYLHNLAPPSITIYTLNYHPLDHYLSFDLVYNLLSFISSLGTHLPYYTIPLPCSLLFSFPRFPSFSHFFLLLQFPRFFLLVPFSLCKS
uniref:Uncharacterized protein n=1 Tax=Cacopsylla melanoneura TaxID=428564 RepID=A0A8D9BIR5_9HEMI